MDSDELLLLSKTEKKVSTTAFCGPNPYMMSVILLLCYIISLILPQTKPKMSVSAPKSLTFIVCPYPVKNERLKNLYLLSFSSYLKASEYSKVLITDSREKFDPSNVLLPEIERRFGNGRLIFSPPLETDENGIPYIDDWFVRGFQSADSDLLCWINPDIVIPSQWYHKVLAVVDNFVTFGKQAIAISQRCDFNVTLGSPESQAWPIDFDSLAKNCTPYRNWGVDFYLISREPMQFNVDSIPPYKMGRYTWDPWLTGWLDNQIGLTYLGDTMTYHVFHQSNNETGEVKAMENLELKARSVRAWKRLVNVRYILKSDSKASYSVHRNLLWKLFS